MTVEELINKLKEMPPKAEVVVRYRDDGGIYYRCDHDRIPILMKSDFNELKKGMVVL